MPVAGSFAGVSARAFGFTGQNEDIGASVIMVPTSVAKTGTGSTATILSSGAVEFSSCTGLSLNGVFTSAFDNYMVVLRLSDDSATSWNLQCRWRVGGADNSTASSYVAQLVSALSTTISGARTTSNIAVAAIFEEDVSQQGMTMHVYRPFLAQPTAARSVTVSAASSAGIRDHAFTHNQSTSYDGFTFISSSPAMTGKVSVYGLKG